jgi:dihydrofolate reductase
MNNTRKVILFSAMSLDGFIAKSNGDIKWLFDIADMEKNDHGFGDFIKTVDTTIIGRKTFDHIISEFDTVYPGKKNYVFSKTQRKPSNNVEFISSDIVAFINELKRKQGGNIWIVGGGDINSILLENNLIDILQLQIFPILLNHGVPLSSCNLNEIRFKFIKNQIYPTGVVDMIYEKENQNI